MEKSYRSLMVLRSTCYVLGAIVLMLGLIGSIWLFTSAAAIPNQMMGLELLGGPALSGLLVRPVMSALSGAGVVVLLFTLPLSLLLFGSGRILAALIDVTRRLDRAERLLEERATLLERTAV